MGRARVRRAPHVLQLIHDQEPRQSRGSFAHEVDVPLCDLGLPDGSWIEVIRQTRLLRPRCDVMVVSMFGDDNDASPLN